MKVKEEKEKLEKLLDTASDSINGDVPTPGNIPEELQTQSTMGIDFTELKDQCNNEARIMINNAIGFILSDDILNENPYLKNKLEVDIMSLGGMLYQVRVNEAMQKAMMEEVDKGFMHPRMFEVFSGLSKTIAEINKQLLGTVEAIKITYKDAKSDIQEKKTDALGESSRNSRGMIEQGDGGVLTMGTKDLINTVKKHKNSQNGYNKPPDISDVEEVQ